MYGHRHICIIDIYIHTYIHTFIYICIMYYTYIHTYTHMHTYIHTYTYTYTHTYTHKTNKLPSPNPSPPYPLLPPPLPPTTALIASSSGRRQSIDLLDGLDLDFLNVKKHFGGSFDGDLFFDELEGGGGPDDPFKLPLSYADDGRAALPPAVAARARASSGQQFNGNGQVGIDR
jgi:hypothetical protein